MEVGIVRYEWKAGARVSLDADETGEELERIRKDRGGTITPEAILKEAKKKRSPLHDHFEWDDTRAAVKYRDVQARYLIRSLVVVFETDDDEEEKVIRPYISIESSEEHEFHNVFVAMDDEELREKILVRAKDELDAWVRRYEQYEELAKVVEAIKSSGGKSGRKRRGSRPTASA